MERTQQSNERVWGGVSLDGLPGPVARALEAEGLREADVRIALESPILSSGRFGSTWFALTPESVVVLEVAADGAPELTFREDVSSVGGARTEFVGGGGKLWLDVDGLAREVLRFDGGAAKAFGTLANRLSQAVSDEPPEDYDPLDFTEVLAEWREAFCPTCGRPLPKNTKVCPACVKRTSTILRVLSFVGPYRNQLIGMMALMVLGTVVALVPPQIARVLLDDVLPNPNSPALLGAVLALAAVKVAQAAIGIARGRMAVRVGSHVVYSIRVRAFNHLQSLSLSYFNKQQTGALMSRINNDTGQMQGFLIDGVQYTVVNVLLVIGIMTAMIWMNPFLGILVIVPMPIVVLLSAFVWKRVHSRFRILWVAAARVSAHLNDTLMGVRVIKAFGRETAEETRYADRAGYHRDRLVEAETTWVTLIPALNFFVQSSVLLIWYFGAGEVWAGDLTIGSLVAYVSYLGLIYGPLQLLTRLNDWLSRSLTAAARVFEILDTQPEIRESEKAVALTDPEGRIELDDVTFGYERHVPVLKGLTVTVEPGTMIGIVGRSGAGKSTLINLVGRLYDVDEGAIRVDGIDIRDLDLEDLRTTVGYVLQDTFLFNGSIAENIAYARPEADRRQVIDAALTANAHQFVMRLPDGYDTVVGERGTKLSGGERQRISIARAILHDPRILILDEATSSVDTETESRIQSALGELVKGRTTLAIAHRLSTLRHADRLIVLEKGKLVEEGTHDELMAIEDGTYRKLVEIQTEWSSTIAVGG